MCAVSIQTRSTSIVLAALYCTPSKRIDAVDFDLVFQNLGPCWLAGGDYNAKHSHWGSRCITPRGRELAKVAEQRQYDFISNGEPTYWPSDPLRNPDVIDFFLSRGTTRRHCAVSTVADLSSDHIPVFLDYATSPQPTICPAGLSNKYTNWEKFRELIEKNIILGQKITTPDQLN